jgi:hypothetical protein
MGLMLGPFAVAASVLLVGGVFKVRDPVPARGMLTAVGVPAPRAMARLSGPVEVILGAGALLFGGRLGAGAVAAIYALFACMVAAVIGDAGADASCGCFGRLSGPASGLHFAADVVLAVTAFAAAVVDVPAPAALVAVLPPLDGLVLVALVALAAWLTIVVLTVLPDALDAGRHPPVHGFRIERAAR